MSLARLRAASVCTSPQEAGFQISAVLVTSDRPRLENTAAEATRTLGDMGGHAAHTPDMPVFPECLFSVPVEFQARMHA